MLRSLHAFSLMLFNARYACDLFIGTEAVCSSRKAGVRLDTGLALAL